MKRSRINPVSKRDDRTMERKLDAMWQTYIIRHHPKCSKCGKPATVAHHVIGRDNKVFRHHPDNGIAFCEKHHGWAHAKPRLLLKGLSAWDHPSMQLWARRFELMDVSMPYRELMTFRMKELKP